MKEKKTILFVCNYYAPDATIAAVRTTKLVKYLREYGFSVDFLSVRNRNLAIDEILEHEANGVDVVYAENSNLQQTIDKRVRKLLGPAKQKRMADMSNRERINPKTGHVEFYPFETAYPVIGSIEYILNLYKQKDLFKSIREWLDYAKSYDYIITSYGDAFCYYVGLYYHRLHPETKWIFDIRDAVYRYKFTPSYVSLIPKQMEAKIWRNADIVTGVSKGICGRVSRKYRSKVHLITNGYDLTDREGVDNSLLSKEKLIMTFTGSMYGGLQNLKPLFRAVKDLIDTKDIKKETIEFHFAGTNSSAEVIKTQLSQYHLEELMVNHGKLSRCETLRLQNCSDVLLTPSYDYENNYGGMLTGKFFEYMSANRPIIAIVTGDIKKSEIAEVTRRCNMGLAYEQSHDDTDYPKLKTYVLKLYNEKIENGHVTYEPDIKEIRRYDYRNLTKRLIKIMVG